MHAADCALIFLESIGRQTYNSKELSYWKLSLCKNWFSVPICTRNIGQHRKTSHLVNQSCLEKLV